MMGLPDPDGAAVFHVHREEKLCLIVPAVPAVQELPVNLRAPGKAAQDEAPPRFFMAEKNNAAAGTFLEGADLFKFQLNHAGQPRVNKRPPPPKVWTLCSYAASIWFFSI